jgi:hypothetical protein
MFSSAETNCSLKSEFRSTLLWTAAKLYLEKTKHTAAEEQQFTELVLGLLDLVDRRTRQAFSKKILKYSNVPMAIRHNLILKKLENSAVTGNEYSFENALASKDELQELFFSADPAERRLILLNLPYSVLKPDPHIAQAITRGANEWLEAAALAQNCEFFARQLQRTSGISQECSRRVINDPWGEPIVVLAIAFGMPAAALKRILLCLNPAIGRDAHRVYKLLDLYEEIATEAALRLIALWKDHRAGKDARCGFEHDQVRELLDNVTGLASFEG